MPIVNVVRYAIYGKFEEKGIQSYPVEPNQMVSHDTTIQITPGFCPPFVCCVRGGVISKTVFKKIGKFRNQKQRKVLERKKTSSTRWLLTISILSLDFTNEDRFDSVLIQRADR